MSSELIWYGYLFVMLWPFVTAFCHRLANCPVFSKTSLVFGICVQARVFWVAKCLALSCILSLLLLN